METCYNIAHAADDTPLTEKFLCVTGTVKNPRAFFAPIGASFGDLIDFVGGASIDDYAIYVSGVMMGQLSLKVRCNGTLATPKRSTRL